MNWLNQVVILTGAGSGIGRGTALSFAEAGAHVVAVDRAADKAEDVAREIMEAGGSGLAIAADAANEADVKRTVQIALERFDKIDVMVNNAAVCPQIRLTEMSLQEWNQVITNNLTSVFLFCREVIPSMLAAGGGAIVNVSSVHALASLDGYSAYSASKAGIVALTRAVALDYARQNIRVNCVLPGAVQTPMLEGSVKNLTTPREEIMQQWNDSQPIGRVGQPKEIAAVIMFAASSANSFMTGATLVADGGMTIDL